MSFRLPVVFLAASVLLILYASPSVAQPQVEGGVTFDGQRLRSYRVVQAWKDWNDQYRLLHARGRRVVLDSMPGPGRKTTFDQAGFWMNTLFAAGITYGYTHVEVDVSPPEPASGDNVDADVQVEVDVDASSIASRLRIFGIVEYEDDNGDERFTPKNDTVSAWYNLNKWFVPWKPFKLTNTNFTVGGEPFAAWEFEAQTLDDVFLMRMVVTGAATRIGAGKVFITPNSAKIDLEIRWFNNSKFPEAQPLGYNPGREKWKNIPILKNLDKCNVTAKFCHPEVVCCGYYAKGPSNSNSSRIALLVGVGGRQASLSVQQTRYFENNTPLQNSVNLGGSGYAAFFTWEGEATIEGGVSANRTTAVGHAEMEFTGSGTTTVGTGASGIKYSVFTSAKGSAQWQMKYLSFTFNDTGRPDLIKWDPEYGADIDYDTFDDMATTTAAGGNTTTTAVSAGSLLVQQPWLAFMMVATVVFVYLSAEGRIA